ncbi:MAG: LysM peptidoglycan-binding domain-containing protein [Solirubrobacteraceae bacterium]
MLAVPAASAHVSHTVAPGETLWGIASQSNLTTRTVAIYNGLAPEASVVAGSTLKIPSVAEGAVALASTGATVSPAASSGSPAPTSAAPRAEAPDALGGYVVRQGDTLTSLAARTPVTVSRLAWVNGLAPDAKLLIGTVLKLPVGAPALSRPASAAPEARVVPDASPSPTPTRLGSQRVKQIAADHGAPASLAAAIGWQESGFNNAMVSTANARGVMQVMPGTWDWVQSNLSRSPLDPASADDNVRAGSLYLANLLRQTGGDVRTAVAGYYQGLSSVRSRGMFDDTKRYVDNVLALQGRFGG